MTSTAPQATDPSQRRPARSHGFLPLALITLGIVFLLGNYLPEPARGGLVVLGLGVAFLIGRLTTGRYGQAVPAGLLIAIGTYLSLHDLRGLQGIQGPAWFFVLLGLGFLLVYGIGLRPSAVWPLFPAAILLALGLVLFGFASLGGLASLSWIVAGWPVALVLLGIWLIFRDRVPVRWQRPLARLGGLALLGYSILAAAASVAAGGAGGPSMFTDTVTLDAPIADGQAFNVDNSSGRTTIHAGSGSAVQVTATRHFGNAGQGPEVRLTPSATGVSLSASTVNGGFPFGSASWVDYAIEIPAGVDVNLESSSGRVDIDGVSGNVKAETSSGVLNVSNMGGAVQAKATSGSISLSNIGGEVRVSTSSGRIQATQVQHLRESTTSSGFMTLEGTFTESARIHASSGAVTVKLLPGSAVQLDAKADSGSVTLQGLPLNGATSTRNSLSGTLGTPLNSATLTIQTSSGSILLIN